MKEQDIDQKLQEQEQEQAKGKSVAYTHVFQALGQAPNYNDSRTLVDGVMHKLARKNKQSKGRYWLFMLLITTVFVGLGFGSLLIFMGWESFSEIKDLSIYGILIGLMVVVIQYFDDKLLKRDLRFS